MYFNPGFAGYRGMLHKKLEQRLRDIVSSTDPSNERFANRFGAGPLRFRLYELGAAQALLLDSIAPEWKKTIFEKGETLTGILSRRLSLGAADQARYLDQAKASYDFDRLLAAGETFNAQGRAYIQQRVDSIVQTAGTLVTISYGGAAKGIKGLSFTPFGVTPVTDRKSIYDLVPIEASFGNGSQLRLKRIIPVLLDRDAKTLTFAVASPAETIVSQGSEIDLSEFSISGPNRIAITRKSNKVTIEFGQ